MFFSIFKTFHVKLYYVADHFKILWNLFQCFWEVENVSLSLFIFCLVNLVFLHFLSLNKVLFLFCLLIHFVYWLIVPDTLFLFVFISNFRTVLKVFLKLCFIDKHSFLVRTLNFVLQIIAMWSTIFWSFYWIEFALSSFSWYPEYTFIWVLCELSFFFFNLNRILIDCLLVIVVLHVFFKQCWK